MTDLHTEAKNLTNVMKGQKMKLFDADGEVRVGDIVRFNGKPCYVERIGELIGITMMDERKTFYRVKPNQIGCVVQREGIDQ